MIQNLIFEILFLKILFWHTTFLSPSTRSRRHHESFLIFRFSSRKSQSQQKLILQYSFAQKTSLILRTSTQLILKITCSHNTAKSLYDFTNFPAKMWCQKIICTAPRTAFLKHVEGKCLYISVYLRKKIFIPKA